MAEERPKGKAKKDTVVKANPKRVARRSIEDILRGAIPLPSTRLFDSVGLREALRASQPFDSVGLREALRASQPFDSVGLREVLRTGQLFDSVGLREVLRTGQLFESLNLRATFASISDWEASLTARMAALQTQWVLRDYPDQSVIGFARLLRLSDAVHTEEPYSEPVGEFVAGELGDGVEEEQDDSPTARDAAAIEAGLNPALIAFPPATYSEVVSRSGFKFNLPPPPMPQAIESADPEAVFDPMYGQVITVLEQQLRNIVEKCLKALEGEKWMKRRVPGDIRQRWLERQKEERELGRPVYSPIQYADFMDLDQVIRRRDNWQESFAPIFRNRDELMVSLHRLHPIRKAIAHSRPLGRFDVVTLVSEATRIFKVLGIQVL